MASTDVQMSGQNDAPSQPMPSASGLEYKLHPLVLVNISDHVMRTFVSSSTPLTSHPRVMGCLLGQHSGRSVDISNSFELMDRTGEDGLPKLDMPLFEQKMDQYKQTFPNQEIIGWYVTGSALQDADMHMHKVIMEHTEAPILLMMDTKRSSVTSKELPLTIYESALHVGEAGPETTFVKADHSITTADAERIAVNAVAQILPSGAGGADSALAQHYSGLIAAMQMLSDRVQLLLQYCTAMQAGKVPHDDKVMRMVSGLLNRLPTMDSESFRGELLKEFSDAAMVNVLSLMTKGVDACNNLVERSHAAYDTSFKG